MSQRCPSCKMESADDAAWCDFCKEPFRKGKAPAPAPERKTTTTQELHPVEKLPEEELLKRLPSEFLKGEDGLAMPKLPPWFKWLAWAFLGSWLITGMILTGIMFGKKKLAETPNQPAPVPGSYDSGPIVVPNR